MLVIYYILIIIITKTRSKFSDSTTQNEHIIKSISAVFTGIQYILV